MANKKLKAYIKEIGWPSFLSEVAYLARQDAGTYGPRNHMLMLLGQELDKLAEAIRGHVPSFPGNYFKEKIEEEGEEDVSS